MPEMIYSFNGKDITMNVCIQIRDVLKLLQDHFQIDFEEAVLRFYKSETYKTLQQTENGLWGQNQQNILQISTMKRWGVNKTLQNMNHIMDSEQEFESAVEQI